MNSRILASLLVIGFAITLAGAGAIAEFTDREKSNNNTLATGKINLKVDWKEWDYNNSLEEEPLRNLDLFNNPSIFNLTDIKPGDNGRAIISLHVYNNDAWVQMQMRNITNDDSGLTEPEKAAGDSTDGSGNGELAQVLDIVIWNEVNNNDQYDAGTDVVLYSGKASGIASPSAWFIDADTTNEVDDALIACENYYVGISWSLPLSTGNTVQTDQFQFDLWWDAIQKRNTSNPFPDTTWTQQ